MEQRIKEKIEKVGVPLKDWDIHINYGIKTGCNEAFIIDRTKRDELIALSPNSVEIIRSYFLGNPILPVRHRYFAYMQSFVVIRYSHQQWHFQKPFLLLSQ